jgi:hypothetical protein
VRWIVTLSERFATLCGDTESCVTDQIRTTMGRD